MNSRTRWMAVAANAIGMLLAGQAQAGLTENQVLLVYNSESAISNSIMTKYTTEHPGVHVLDLDIDYTRVKHQPDVHTLTPGCTGMIYPGPHAVTEFYATFAAYETHIKTPIAAYVALNPEVLCIVTTRGLPAAITDLGLDSPPRFYGSAFHNYNSVGDPCAGNHPIVSLESELADLHDDLPGSGFTNPYYGMIDVPITDFMDGACNLEEEGHYVGRFFLTSRLDSSNNNNQTYLANIEDLIDRSVAPGADQEDAVMVFDEGCDDEDHLELTGIAQDLRNDGWCVYFDTTEAFLDGLNTPCNSDPCSTTLNPCDSSPIADPCGTLDPAIEGEYQHFQELIHIGLGRNHTVPANCDTSEDVCAQYARYYDAHPAGFFYSYESYGGIAVREPGFGTCPTPSSWIHGSQIDWIAAGGSFALGNINGPIGGLGWDGHYIIENLYRRGLSWGEAVWSGIPKVNREQTPIGDPLAVVAIVPRVERDEDCEGFPAIPAWSVWPPVFGSEPCGDVNRDGYIDSVDRDLVERSIGLAYCPKFDLDEDGDIDADDLNVIDSHPAGLKGDSDNNDCLDVGDIVNMVLSYSCDPDPEYNILMDMDCNGCLNGSDLALMVASMHHHPCP